MTRITAGKLVWIIGDSAYDTLDWRDPRGQQVVVPVITYYTLNTDDRKASSTRLKTASNNARGRSAEAIQVG